jgi:amino-acid N-acetyltransferase
MPINIEEATPQDEPAIRRLLSDNALPLDGLTPHLDTAIVARIDDRVVGCAALEIYADGALLRSVAVDAGARDQGIGAQLTTSALDLAHARGTTTVYLLTTTADAFFSKFAFERITRNDVPASVQASVEFQGACPSTAIVMKKVIASPADRVR